MNDRETPRVPSPWISRLRCLFLLGCLFLGMPPGGTATLAAPTPASVWLPDYDSPVYEGNSWTYESSDGDGRPWTTVITVQSANTTITSYTGRNPIVPVMRQAVAVRRQQGGSAGVRYHPLPDQGWGLLGSDDEDDEVRLDPPWIITNRVTVGQALSFSGTLYSQGGNPRSGTVVLLVLGFENVSVAGQTYRDCLRVRITFTTARGSGVDEQWLAPGFGAVKFTHSSPGEPVETNILVSSSFVSPPERIVWQEGIGGTGTEDVFDMGLAPDGGAVLAGYSASPISGNKQAPAFGDRDYWLVRLDGSGRRVWDRTYGGSGVDSAFAVEPRSGGGWIMGGTSSSPPGPGKSARSIGGDDFWVVAVDEQGMRVWDESYGGTGAEELNAILPAPDGGWLLCGGSNSGASGNKTSDGFGQYDGWVIRVDAQGRKLWERTFGTTESDHVYAGAPASNGWLLAAFSGTAANGNREAPAYGQQDVWLLRLDAEGNIVWQRSYGGDADDVPRAVVPAAAGGWLVAADTRSGASGNKTSVGLGGVDRWLLRLDASGNLLWERTLGSPEDDSVQAAVELSGDGWLVAGHSARDGQGAKPDYCLAWLGPRGEMLSQRWLGGPGDEHLHRVSATGAGSIWLAGSTEGLASGDRTTPSFGERDLWIVQLGPEAIRPPRLALVGGGSDGGFRLRLEGEVGWTYQIETSTAVSDSITWVPAMVMALSSEVVEIGPPGLADTGQAYFRARALTAALVDDRAPMLAINSPTPNQQILEEAWTVRGTAAGVVAVERVMVRLNGGAWEAATGSRTWEFPARLLVGPNTIAAYAVDAAGNRSVTNVVKVTSMLDMARAYWPMHSGDRKTYDGPLGIATLECSERSPWNGSTYALELDSEHGDSLSVYQYANGGKELLLTGVGEIGQSFDFNPPVVEFDANMLQNGGSRGSTSEIQVSGTTIALSVWTTVSSAGRVTVPAGTYSDCRRMDVTITATVPGKGTFTLANEAYILAPRVGPICIGARETSDGVTFRFLGWEELVSGQVGGVDVGQLATGSMPGLADAPATSTSRNDPW